MNNTPTATNQRNGKVKEQLKLILSSHRGLTNALPRRELRVILNDIDDRKMRNLIKELRREGLPVLSSVSGQNGGYYLPASKPELRTGLKTMQSYIIELCKDYRDIKKAGNILLEKPQPPVQERLM